MEEGDVRCVNRNEFARKETVKLPQHHSSTPLIVKPVYESEIVIRIAEVAVQLVRATHPQKKVSVDGATATTKK